MKKVLRSPSLELLERAFIDHVAAAKSSDPLAQVTVLVGSNLQHIYLRRHLARELGAVANVRFLTLLDLAGQIYLVLPETEPLQPLPEGGDALLLRGILRDNGLGGLDSPLGVTCRASQKP